MINEFIQETFGASGDFVQYLITFLISMLPIVELRGAIPVGIAFGIPWYWNYLLCVVGNLLPVPFILIFIRRLITWFKTTKHLKKLGLWLESKAAKNTEKVQRYEIFGLMLFVSIPLPMTGAWTGSLVAALTNMKFKYSMLSVICGVLIAGAIVTLICEGVLGFLNFMI